MNTSLHDPRSPARTVRPASRFSRLTIFGRHFAIVWRGRGWELVAVVALLIVALLVWLSWR